MQHEALAFNDDRHVLHSVALERLASLLKQECQGFNNDPALVHSVRYSSTANVQGLYNIFTC